MDRIQDAIDAIDGLADNGDDDIADMYNSVTDTIKALRDTAREVMDSADDTGCDGGLTVVDGNALARLNNLVYPDFPIGEEIEDEDEDFGDKINRLIDEGMTDEDVILFLDEDERGMLVSLIRVRREKEQGQ